MISRRQMFLGMLFFTAAGCSQRSEQQDLQLPIETCQPVDLERYFSFTISDELKPLYFGHDYDPGDLWNSDTQMVDLIQSALQEILNTPEGLTLITSAVQRFNGNKIHFDIDDFREVGEADAKAGVPFIRVGNGWVSRSMTYMSNGQRKQLSIQRFLIHELYHLSKGHVTGEAQNFDARRSQYETETVAFTDNYMHKYYGEARKESYSNFSLEGGTDRWDFSRKIVGCSVSI